MGKQRNHPKPILAVGPPGALHCQPFNEMIVAFVVFFLSLIVFYLFVTTKQFHKLQGWLEIGVR